MDLTRSRAGRRVLFTVLYATEGAPIGFLWWTLPGLLRAAGAEPDRIGSLLALLVLPWALKWLWSPVVDLFQGPRWTLRGWISVAQLGMAASFAPLLFLEPGELLDRALPFLFAHAMFASTQDAAIDALMLRVTPPDERGRLTAWMQVGMLAGRALVGGGALLAYDRLGWNGVVGAVGAALLLGLAALPFYRAPRPEPGAGARRPLSPVLRDVLRRRTTWIGLAFAATAGAGFEAVGAFASPLLTEVAGGEVQAAGRFFLLDVVVALALGGFAGGFAADRRGPRAATLACGALLAALVFGTSVRVGAWTAPGEAFAWLAAVYLGIGAFTASSYALFLAWTDPRLGATQFSAYMGATNLCEAWAAELAGEVAAAEGYGPAFAAAQAVGLAALVALGLGTRRSGSA